MSDSGGTRLTIDDDNELSPRTPTENPLAPFTVQKPEKPSDVFRFIGNVAAMYGSHLAQGLWDAGPGAIKKVMTGEVQPGTPEFNQLGAESALAYGILAAPMPRPYGSLGTFGGMWAKGAPIHTVDEAIRMERGGWPHNAPADPTAIFDKTGWFKGPDGLWRFNISDAGAELNLNKMSENSFVSAFSGQPHTLYNVPISFTEKFKLSDFLKHDELFKHYPALADIEVRPVPLGSIGTTKGAYNPDTNILYLGGGTKEEVMSTALHEIQHAIQKREGFARGGNIEEFLPPKFDERVAYNKEQLKDLNREIATHGIDDFDLKRVHGLPPFDKPVTWGMDVNKYMTARNLPADLVDRYKKALAEGVEIDNVVSKARDDYFRLAGETESRAAQAQHAARVWNRPPWEVGDFRGGKVVPYPTEPQIVKSQTSGPSGPQPMVFDPPAGGPNQPMVFDPATLPPGTAKAEIFDLGQRRAQQQAEQEAAKREKVRQGLEEMRSRLVDRPSYPIPAPVKDALKYFDSLGFEAHGEAISALRQAGPDWQKQFDMRPMHEFMPKLNDLERHKDALLHKQHISTLNKYLSRPPGGWPEGTPFP